MWKSVCWGRDALGTYTCVESTGGPREHQEQIPQTECLLVVEKSCMLFSAGSISSFDMIGMFSDLSWKGESFTKTKLSVKVRI